MRKLYTLLIMFLAPLAALLAQPTILVEDATACTGDNFCVEVTAEDFTNINSLDFDFGYDADVLTFTGAQNFNAEMQAEGNLGPALFDGSTPGVISFGVWETANGDCLDPQNFGSTLDDGEVLFELCFEAIGAYGAQSGIGINAFPTPLCTRNSTGCSNIGLLRQDGEVTLCVREFNVTAADVTGNEGDQVCIDFTVDGWDALTGIQFTVNYDPAFLNFESLFPNTEITSNTLAAYGLPGDINEDGAITVAYSYTIPDPSSISVVDGTTMFTVCFTIIGACETGTLITFSDAPTPIQINNEDPDNPDENSIVPVSLNPGSVLVNDCNPEGIEIIIDCGPPADVNDIVCVQFQAGSNFDAVRRMEYLMTWNPNVLEFIEVNTAGNLAGLTYPGPDFIEDNVGNGILGIDWEFTAGPAQNLDNLEEIYEVCFRVIGVGGDSPIQINTPGIGVSNGVNIGINPTNCVVEVNQPESVVVDFGSMDTPLGGSDCVPVTVGNFNEVLSSQFTMNWDEMIWSFTGTQNVNPAIAGATTFTPVGASSLGFVFNNGNTPVTLPNNTVLFEACFETAPTASPGDCDVLETVGLPFAESAITANSNGDNIGLLVNPGELCVLFPEGFGLEAVSTSGGWLDTVCMNFTVESFDNITAANFNLLWTIGELEFVSATPLGWADLMINTPNPTGTLNATFFSPIPTAIPDGEVAFEVCFQLVGDPNECYEVEIQNMPPPQVQTANGQGSIVITNGEICVEEQIVINDITITPPSCPGACDGVIEIDVAEWAGQGFIGTTWSFEQIPFMDFSPLILDDICEGRVIFTVFDNGSGVSLTDTIFMVSDGVVPEAAINGAEVRELDCAGGQVALSTSSGGDGLSIFWYLNTTSSTSIGNNASVTVSSTGNVILQIVDQITGCSATDTIMIIAPGLPVADAGEVTESFDCNTTSITLDGSGSTGDNLIYTWSQQIDGTFVVVGAGETYDATSPGTYRLTVENGATGCENDINDPNNVVVIVNDQVTPLACVELDGGGSNIQEQNCDGTPIIFSAECSDLEDQIVDRFWYEYDFANGTFGAALGNGITQEATELGYYAVEIINITTGCRDTAFAQIIPNTSAPVVSIDAPAAFDCNTESIVLNGSFSPNDATFTFEWIESGGAEIEPGTETTLQPQANTPGTYRLVVTNPDNMCVGDSTVVIIDQTDPPFVEITNNPDSLEVSCLNPSLTLRATPSELLSYQWFLENTNMGSEIEDANADSLVVSVGGNYIVQVTNPTTGCVSTATVEVTGQFETPAVILDETEVELTCTDSTITITATIQGSTDFTLVDWTSTPAEAIDDADITNGGLTITVRSPGIYNLGAVSNLSGCDNEADVVVTLNNAPPTVDVLTDTLTINCLSGTVQLSGAGSSAGQDFSYLWENLDGDGPDDPTALQTSTSTPGTYRFTVTNMSNGCTADTLVVVGTDLEEPMLTIDPVAPITCDDSMRDLTVVVTGADNFIVLWSDGSPLDEVTTTVDTTGTFSVTVTNTDNGCSSTAEITVDGNVTEPEVIIAAPAQFDCPDEFVVIDATATGNPGDFTEIIWDLDGGILTGENNLTLNATALGTYTLTVRDVTNGCTGSASVTVVAADELTLPELPMITPDLLGCDGTPVTIDASAADDGTDYLSVDWSTLNGTFTIVSPFVIEATAAGVYTLEVTVNSPVMGCTNSASYTVFLDPNTPIADAGADQIARCGAPATIDASGSTPPSATITYSWAELPGSEPLTGDLQSPMPMAAGAGTYVLTVENTENGCTATDTVAVTFEFPADANAGVDVAACDDIADLSGNQPANTTGLWTTTSSATIDMPMNSITMVSDLSQGANAFTWTLSAPGCPDYSSDQIIVTRANAPTALPDMLEMEFGQLTGTVNLVANDQLGGSTDFNITITTGPTFGTFDTLALEQGDFVFTVAPNAFGVTQVTYEICSADCPDLCATATLDITVLPGDETFVPNTITPNGDGANDNLVFDILLFNPADDFPDNEIIIFNRWGDIIYEAQPYNNDWNGLSQDGTPVAEGTYYFVLRLNISRGEIIRGDITVIR